MKILVNGPIFYTYNSMITKAIDSFADTTELLDWPDLYSAVGYRWKSFVSQILHMKMDETDRLNKFMRNEIIDFNKKLIEQIKKIEPDLILTLRGDILFPETVKSIKSITSSPHVIWCYDSPFRYKNILNSAKLYDYFYTFEPSDVSKLKKYKVEAKVLPMAYDPDCYFKLKGDIEQSIDISFIGNLYPARKELLDNVCSLNENLNLQIWSRCWTWYNPLSYYNYKVKTQKLSSKINNYDIDYNRINNIYNQSKICLNMHHSQSLEGLNPRTFEILGSGGFELIDYKASLNDLFEIGTEIECYSTEKELFDKINYYIENGDEREKIAKRGQKRVYRDHTYVNRVQRMLEDVDLI